MKTTSTNDGFAEEDTRVLVRIPNARDAALVRGALEEAGLRVQVCPGIEAMGQALEKGAGAALIAQEALTPPVLEQLARLLSQQPPWSDLPLIVLTGSGRSDDAAAEVLHRLERLGNATFLERPLRKATLVRSAQVALRTRRRQYEIREHLRTRENNAAEIAALLRQQRAFLRDVLASVTGGKLRLCEAPKALPPPQPEAAEEVSLSSSTLRLLRRRVQEAAQSQNFDTDRTSDLITAVSEAGMNAVVHAGGGRARIGVSPAGIVQVWITDTGTGIDVGALPRATLERGYSSAGTLGHGFWLMLNTVDRVFLLTGAEGTTLVLEQERTPPEPVWLREA